MTRTTPRAGRGFTLIAALAAIVVPIFTRPGDSAESVSGRSAAPPTSSKEGTEHAGDPLATLLPFSLRKELLGPPLQTGLFPEEINPQTGEVRMAGTLTESVKEPFTWNWGDGSETRGFFPQSHQYKVPRRNYLVTMTYRQSDGRDEVGVSPVFLTMAGIKPVPLPSQVRVSIPALKVPILDLSTGRSQYANTPKIVPFDDSFFKSISRAEWEYVLTATAATLKELVNDDITMGDGTFRQLMVRDPAFGGAYAITNSRPVTFAVGDVFMKGRPPWSALAHEMAHNFTLNSPARAPKRAGHPLGALVVESQANIVAFAACTDLVNSHQRWGLDRLLAFSISHDTRLGMGHFRRCYDDYVKDGKRFDTILADPKHPNSVWLLNVPVYVFYRHAEEAARGYRIPTKRFMQFFQINDEALGKLGKVGKDRRQKHLIDATVLIAAMSYGLQKDLRTEFRALSYPVEDGIFTTLTQRALSGSG